MNDIAEMHWRMYNEHRTHARHHEMLRATVANIVLAVGGGVVTVVGFQKELRPEHWPLSVLLTLMGLYGMAFTMKQFERIELHMHRARAHRAKIDTLLASDLATTSVVAGEEHNKKWPFLHKVKSNHLWMGLHGVVALVGIAITVRCWLIHH